MARTAAKPQASEPARTDRGEAHPIAQSLEPIYDLNRRMFALLTASDRDGAEHPDFDPKTSVAVVLREIEPPARQRLALCPFLLLDASFHNASKWRRADAQSEPAVATQSIDEPYTRVLALARATCLVAWYLARTNPIAARLVLGVSRECARVIAESGLTDLEEIAARLIRERLFKPRWHDRPEVWHRLIRLALNAPHVPVGVHGLQLFLGDLLSEEESQL
jgi:hypothetical protein